MNTDHGAVRDLLGGYLLGGLDEADQRLVDAHVRTCDACREELDLLGPVPELLMRLPSGASATAIAPSPVQLEDLLGKVRARRRRLRRSWLTLVAAVAVLVVVGVAVALRPSSPGGQTFAFAPVAHSTTVGQAVLTPKPWGTAVTVRVSGLPATGRCELQVVGRDGQVEQAATWGPAPTLTAQISGASSMPMSTVRAVNVLGEGGTVLATATIR